MMSLHPGVNILDLLLKKGGSMYARADHQMSCVLVEHVAVGAAAVLLPLRPNTQPFSCPAEARALLAVPEIIHVWFVVQYQLKGVKVDRLKGCAVKDSLFGVESFDLWLTLSPASSLSL